MSDVVLGVVNKSILDEDQGKENRNLQPTLTIDDGTVDVFISLDIDKPASSATMFLDATLDATGANKSFIFTGMCRWIAFEQNAGTSVVVSQGVIPE